MIDYEKIKEEIRIIDYAAEIGLTPKRIGSRYYTLKEHDSVRIDPDKNIFIQNSTGKAGSIVDFAMCFTKKTYNEIVSEFARRLGNDNTKSKKVSDFSRGSAAPGCKKVLLLPDADKNMKNIFAYLIKSRGISADIVKEMVLRKQLYQDTNRNCVFVSYKDSVPVFACKRGTSTYKRFLGDVSGSDYSFLFFIDNNSSKLVITESVIDALSKMTIIKDFTGADYKEYNYLALSGCSKFEQALSFHLNRTLYGQIFLCLDNDNAGLKSIDEIILLLERLNYNGDIIISLPKFGKDINDELKKIKEK